MQPLIAQSGLYRAVFVVTVALVAIPQLYGTLRLQPKAGADIRDRNSYRAVHGSVAVGVLLAYWCATRFDGAAMTWHRHAIFDAGLGLIAGGALLTMYTIWLLGPSFTVQVAVRPGQQVVESGPYRWVRHPSYAAQMLSLLGFGLVLTNWVSIAGLMACAAVGYGYRIAVEERVLLGALGEPYASYMQRTRKLIPFVF
jgi:protein-S-isoprenylcysteine O-methyltransferase Ste14